MHPISEITRKNRQLCYLPAMATINRTSKAKAKAESMTIGMAGFAKISAVEGVRLSSESRRMFAEFERKGMSAQQRRKAIAMKHAKKA